MGLIFGVTDYVPLPFSVEREVLGDDWELINLNVNSPEEFA